MSDLGQLLKKARTEKGMTLDHLQDVTKIRKRYLEAIEEGNYKILPGNFYVRAFIKSYSEAVGLEPEEVLRLYRNVIPEANSEQHIEPIRRTRRNSGNSEKFSKWASAVLMWSFPLLIIGVIWYYFYLSHDAKNNILDPAPITNKTPGTDSSPDNKPEPTIDEEDPNAPEPEPPKAEPAVILASSTTAADTYTATETDHLVVQITVIGAKCWMEIREGNKQGKVVTSKEYKKGDTLSYETKDSIYIRFGAPAAVELKVNGTILKTSGLINPKDFQVNLTPSDQLE